MKKLQIFLKIFSFIAILITVFILFFHQVTSLNEDLGRHIISGHLMLTSKHVISKNFFSFTNPYYPFVNVYWLSEIIFYLLYIKAGFLGLLLLTTSFAVISCFILLVPFIKQKIILPVLISFIILLGIFLLRTEVRPEIFSYFFLSLFTSLLFTFRRRYTPLLFILIPCMLIWTNLHIYFVLGLGLLGFYCLDSLFYERHSLPVWITHPKRISSSTKIILITTILSTLISLINPYGIKLLFYPFVVTSHLGYIPLELQNTFLIESYVSVPSIEIFKASVILIFLLLFFNRKRAFLSDWLIAIGFTVLGIQAIRNLNLYAIAVSPILTYQLIILYKTSFNTIKHIKKLSLIIKIFLTFTIIIAFVCICTYSIIFRGFGYSTPQGIKKAVNFVEKEHIQGPFFNNFDIGSYLIFRFYPKYKVFIDNRVEAYPQSFYKNVYIPMMDNQRLFNQVAITYNLKAAIITITDELPLVKQLIKNKDWVLIYLNNYAAIFVKNIPENYSLIHKFSITDKNLINNLKH